MSVEITHNEYFDEFNSKFPEANNLIRILRKRCVDANENISKNVTLHSNRHKKVLYLKGFSMSEIFIAAVYDYLCSVDAIDVLAFNIPRFSIECVTFTFKKCETTTYDEAYFDSILPSASVLQNSLKQRYLNYHKFMSTDKVFVEKHQMILGKK